jgi:2-polyprenyl-6-methoxyphenol hydroxylase-like FAD-dependent oxidoreductase
MQNRKILISGAGIAGTALAGQLLARGFEPVLIERAPAFRDGGYMIDVGGTGYDLVERYGLLEAARARSYAFDRMSFVNADGKLVSSFGGEVLRRAMEGRFFSIPRGDLARVLHDPITGKVETLYGVTIDALREDSTGVEVTLSNGFLRRFDLVVGAEGVRSPLRARIFGTDEQFEKFLGYYAASFITQDYPHRDEGVYLSHAVPGRQISRYAMRGGRTAFLLVFVQDAPLAAHDIQARKALLAARFGADGWETPQILARLAQADELYFDAVSQIRMPHWSRGRVALIGDAAYGPSLLAGAGSAFAMLGAYVLAGELAEAAGDHARAFAAYEKKLHPFLLRQQDRAISFAGSFLPRTKFGLGFRNLVLGAMNFPPLGTLFVRQMVGERYPLPDYNQPAAR